MKKILLSCAALFMSVAASADSYDVFIPKEGSTTTITVREDKSAADMLAETKDKNTIDYWGTCGFPAGTVMYSGPLMTVTAENDCYVYTDNSQNKALLLEEGHHNGINYGIEKNTLNNNFKAEEFDASEFANLNSLGTLQGQSILKITPNQSGKLGCKIINCKKGDATRSYAIVSTKELVNDFLGEKYTAFYTVALNNTADAISTVEGDVEAGKDYWIIAAGQNNTLYEISLTQGGASLGDAETWSLTAVLPEGFNGKQAANDEGFMTIKDGSAYIYGETENVKVTYVSTPDGGTVDETADPSKAVKDTDLDECLDGKKTWVDLRGNMDPANNKTYNATFCQCLMGRGNPQIVREYSTTWNADKDYYVLSPNNAEETYYTPDCGKLPQVGTYVEFEVAKEGTMEAVLMIWRANNPLYIIDEATTEPIPANSITYKGWINNNTTEWIDRTLADDYLPHYNEISHTEKNEAGEDIKVVDRPADNKKELAAAFTFNVKPGKYMAISPKSQIGFYGYNFYASEDTGIENVAVVRPVSNVIYNLAGQVVDKNYKGIIIVNGKKFLNK